MHDSHRKIAIVHDFLYCYAGAERVLEQIINVFPESDLFALFDFLPADRRGFIQNKPVRHSFIQRLPFARTRHRHYLPLMPLAIEQLDLSAYDVVLSSSYLAAKGVITRPDQLHICYCHSPVRFAWDMQHQYLTESGLARGIKSVAARAILHYIRNWDQRSAQGVDVFVTNSQFISRRVRKIYRRSSTPIYPPVDIDRFVPSSTREDYYVTASRMVPYKRMDVIVEAFNRMPDKRLVVLGDGPDFRKISQSASRNIQVLGHQPFDVLRRHLQNARAFVFAAEEDFGIAPVEAQACGTPVIAFGRGGVTESVVDRQTGLFFDEQTPASLIEAVTEFESMGDSWDVSAIRQNAERFSPGRFRERFEDLVEAEWSDRRATRLQEAADLCAFRDEPRDGIRAVRPALLTARETRLGHVAGQRL